jgi:glutamate N-acetyltransferase/amino-acid N-acetyltransferase
LRRTGGPDLSLIVSDRPASAAAVFTQNLVEAAPVTLSREHVRRAGARMRAIVVNAGNANCCTGGPGMRAARETARHVARLAGCRPDEVVVCSTGVIGVPMRVGKILRALPACARGLAATPAGFAAVTRAILTTDTRPKWAAAQVRIGGHEVRLLGFAKGAGMIHPNMATMLAFVLTDAAVAPPLLQRALREVTERTFNCVTVDGDTSTNDTLAALANGASGAVVGTALRRPVSARAGRRGNPARAEYAQFVAALDDVCASLARQIAADGEGARRLVEIAVRGAANDQDAKRVAETIATSPLVKTALAGADPNWGRILAAAGRSGVRFDPARAVIWLAGVKVYSRGRPLPFSERAVSRRMRVPVVPMMVDLGGRRRSRSGHARYWTCDFTGDYVLINASYRT